MCFIIRFIQASKGQGKIDNNRSKHSKKKLIKWQKGMLSIFCSTEFSFKTPQNWAFFIWTFSLFPPHLSFNKPDLMFLFIVGRAGDLFSLLFFLIYYLFSFYFVLCVFQLFPLWNSFVHRWSWSQGSTLLREKKKKKDVTFSIYKRL